MYGTFFGALSNSFIYWVYSHNLPKLWDNRFFNFCKAPLFFSRITTPDKSDSKIDTMQINLLIIWIVRELWNYENAEIPGKQKTLIKNIDKCAKRYSHRDIQKGWSPFVFIFIWFFFFHLFISESSGVIWIRSVLVKRFFLIEIPFEKIIYNLFDSNSLFMINRKYYFLRNISQLTHDKSPILYIFLYRAPQIFLFFLNYDIRGECIGESFLFSHLNHLEWRI